MRSPLALLAILSLSLPAADFLIAGKDGTISEQSASLSSIRLTVDGRSRAIPVSQILSIHNGEPATAAETERIARGIAAIQGADRKARDLAVEDLTALGVPVVTPLLKTYKDTDQHEPRPLYRLFERVMPSHADTFDRTLSLVRLANGEALRGTVEPFAVGPHNWSAIRAIAVKQKRIARRLEVHSIRHSTQIEFFDTGVVLSASSAASGQASGFTRLSWETDGWATDPNGLQKPGPNYKTNLVDGHPFGALVGRFGAAGEVFFAGRSWTAKPGSRGRLYLAINDNRHWQNNLGTYRVVLTAANAYDFGDPQ